MAKFDVSVVGELNLDLILYGLPRQLEFDREHLAQDLSMTLGSSSAIFTHNLALLGNKVGFSSSIGNDPLGEICLQRLGESGANVDGVRCFPGKKTGLTVILPSGAERYILTYPGTMFETRYEDLDLGYVLDARHFHLSSYYLHRALRPRIAELFHAAKKAGLTTSLDTNDDPENLWADDLLPVLNHVDVLLPNEREASRIARTEDAARAADILTEKVPLLVIKRGKQGAIARRGKERFVSAPVEVEMVDPVGAGDSFDAGFIHQFIRGAGIEECLNYGNLAGALSTTRAGGTEAFRDVAYRERFLRKRWGASPSSR
jgi:sugar/nucleoside kinase (ribokinase family)